MERFTEERTCPVCDGHEALPRGAARRCFGFLSSDGAYAHCTREEYAGSLVLNPQSQTYAHHLRGACRCGELHTQSAASSINSEALKTTPIRRYAEVRGRKVEKTYEYPGGIYKVRFSPKTFCWAIKSDCGELVTGPGVLDGLRKEPYRLNELLSAPREKTRWAFEGEEDADLAWNDQLVATNSKSITKENSHSLKGLRWVVVQDHDKVGQRIAEGTANVLVAAGAVTVKIVDPHQGTPLSEKDGKDYRDWREDGHAPGELTRLADDAPEVASQKAKSPWDRALPVSEFVNSEEPSVEWEEEPFLAPGSITEVFSPRGIGKTHWAMWLAIKKARQGRRVLYIDRDNSTREVRRRLLAWGAASVVDGTLRILTRDNAPPLTDSSSWKSFPVDEYDIIIVDSLDSSTEGVGEQDSARAGRTIAVVNDLVHQADGPALLILGNTIKSGKHGRGSGVIEDRADIVFEVRDATDLKPSGKVPWFQELPEGGVSHWAERAGRRRQRDRYKLAFVPSKFRIGEEPEPILVEIDLSSDQWQLRDATGDILQEAVGAVARVEQEREDRLDRAREALQYKIENPSTGRHFLKGDAERLLMDECDLKRWEARRLIQDRAGKDWVLSPVPGKGHPMGLFPLSENGSEGEYGGGRNVQAESALESASLEPSIPADRSRQARQQRGHRNPSSNKANTDRAFRRRGATNPTGEDSTETRGTEGQRRLRTSIRPGGEELE